jgi:type IV secretory pathway component VirB8
MNQDHSSGLSTSPAMTVMEMDSASVTKRQTTLVISLITYSTGITTFLAGVVTMAIPIITTDLHLPQNLVLWYFKENKPFLRCYGQSLMVRVLLI